MKDIAVNRLVSGWSAITSAIHPVLGIVFSIIASLFGWGHSKSSNIAEEILKEVETMISNAKNEIMGEIAQSKFTGVMTAISYAGDNVGQWEDIPGKFADVYSFIFSDSCWNMGDSTWKKQKCNTWRVQEVVSGGTDGGAKGLLVSLKFTELMLLSGGTLMEYGIPFEAFAEHIVLAASLTLDHHAAYKTKRLQFDSAEHGVRTGEVKCGGRDTSRTKRTCETHPGQDLFLNKAICGAEKRKTSTYAGGETALKKGLQHNLNACFAKLKTDTIKGLEQLQDEARQTFRASKNLRRGEATLRCGSPDCR